MACGLLRAHVRWLPASVRRLDANPPSLCVYSPRPTKTQVRVRLDERRIGEILSGLDSASMGPAFVSTAGRLLGHLGDVMTMGFTPTAGACVCVGGGALEEGNRAARITWAALY